MSLAEIPRSRFQSKWSSEMEARLSTLWGEGIRVFEIAVLINAEFGERFNKNAIIGKAHRSGLQRHRNANKVYVDDVTRDQCRRERAMELQRIRRGSNRLAPMRRLVPSIEDCSIPMEQRKNLLELGPHDCRFIVGDPMSGPFFFCGGVAEEGKPYCSRHCARAYREPNLR